jgi:hypothetical protein
MIITLEYTYQHTCTSQPVTLNQLLEFVQLMSRSSLPYIAEADGIEQDVEREGERENLARPARLCLSRDE